MKIGNDAFSGERPRLTAHKLGVYEAQLAENARLEKADCRPWRAPLLIADLTGTSYQTLFEWTASTVSHWVTSANDLDWIRSPIANDTYERLYFTGEATLRVLVNDIVSSPFNPATDFYLWGVPAPTATLTVERSGATERYYFYTFLNAYGEEGAGGDAVGGSDVNDSTPTLTTIQACPASRRITGINLYRTNSTTDGKGQFQYVLTATYFDTVTDYVVGDFVLYSATPTTNSFALYKCTTPHSHGAWDAGNFTAGDDVADAALGDVCESDDYDPPPTGMKGVRMLPNGIAIGFVGNEVYFSEPWLPHAWPNKYAQSVEEDIVAVEIFGNNAVLLTDGYPYLITGSAPEQMTLTKYPEFAPCLAKRGVVTGMGGVMFPTKEGVALATTESLSVISAPFITPTDWEAYYPSTMHADFVDGKYFAWYVNGTTFGGIMIDFTNEVWIRIPFKAQAGYVAIETGKYYIVVDGASTASPTPQCIKEWDGDPYNYMYMKWKSRKYLFSSDINFSAARITIDQESYASILELIEANNYIIDQNETLINASTAQINGDKSTFTGTSNDKIKVIVDNTEKDDINIGACTNIAGVVTAINTAFGATVASADSDGYLQIVGELHVEIADGGTTAQTVIADLFSVSGDRSNTCTGLEGNINESSFNEYSILSDEIQGASTVSITNAIMFKLYSDGVLVFSRTVTDGEIFRLPKGYRTHDCEYQIEGYIPVRKVEIATSVGELVYGE